MSCCRLCLRHEGVLGNDRLVISLLRRYKSLQRVQVMQQMTLAEVQVKWSVILTERLGPNGFFDVANKWTCFASCALKVPGWLIVWNALLTKKLRTFLCRLNEISVGCEKILAVSGSFWSNFKFFRMMDCEGEWNSLFLYKSPYPFKSSDCHKFSFFNDGSLWSSHFDLFDKLFSFLAFAKS